MKFWLLLFDSFLTPHMFHFKIVLILFSIVDSDQFGHARIGHEKGHHFIWIQKTKKPSSLSSRNFILNSLIYLPLTINFYLCTHRQRQQLHRPIPNKLNRGSFHRSFMIGAVVRVLVVLCFTFDALVTIPSSSLCSSNL